MIFATFAKGNYELRTSKDLLRFMQVLGMTPLEAKKAVSFERKEDSLIKVIK